MVVGTGTAVDGVGARPDSDWGLLQERRWPRLTTVMDTGIQPMITDMPIQPVTGFAVGVLMGHTECESVTVTKLSGAFEGRRANPATLYLAITKTLACRATSTSSGR